MNKLEFVQSLFPDGEVTSSFEVNGLKAATVPLNCEVLDRWQDTNASERREFFLVTADSYIALLRVCKAGSYVDYDEFAVVHKVATVGTEQAEVVKETNVRWRSAHV